MMKKCKWISDPPNIKYNCDEYLGQMCRLFMRASKYIFWETTIVKACQTGLNYSKTVLIY